MRFIWRLRSRSCGQSRDRRSRVDGARARLWGFKSGAIHEIVGIDQRESS
jgi:hypothetical protein